MPNPPKPPEKGADGSAPEVKARDQSERDNPFATKRPRYNDAQNAKEDGPSIRDRIREYLKDDEEYQHAIDTIAKYDTIKVRGRGELIPNREEHLAKDEIQDRLVRLDEEFPVPAGRRKASEAVAALFPEIFEHDPIERSGGALAQAAAQPRPQWVNREPGDTPVTFIRKHYGLWRDGEWDRDGLTRPALRKADHQLYNALAQWERRHPEDRLQLPGQSEETATWVDRMTSGDAGPTTAAERDRLRNAQRRIAAREGKS